MNHTEQNLFQNIFMLEGIMIIDFPLECLFFIFPQKLTLMRNYIKNE